MFQTCILLTLLAVVHGDYSSPPPGPGYTTPTDNPPLPTLLHNPTATYPAPTPVPYTAAVVKAAPSTPSTPSVTTMAAPSSSTLYPSVGQTNNGYSYPAPSHSNSPLYHQLYPQFISQYYKQPPFANPYSQQPFTPSHTLNSPSFQPHSCSSQNNPSFHPQQPYFQSNLFQVPNPLSFLNGLASPNSFHAMINPPGPRGPLPSPGYYSPNPNHPTSQPLFTVGYSSPVNRPLPYNVH